MKYFNSIWWIISQRFAVFSYL